MQYLHFCIDDSGTLHPHSSVPYFVYAGYVFQSKLKQDNVKRNYRSLSNRIRNAREIEEAKAFYLKDYPDDKRKLYSLMKANESFHVMVNINNVYDSILSSKKSICRYKDYVLKRAIKSKIVSLVKQRKFDPIQDTHLIISLDEQATSSDGYYDLRESIYEELANGIQNFDYGKFHKPILKGKLIVDVDFFDSKDNYMIQASDILANRIWSSYVQNRIDWRTIPNHNILTLP